MVDSLFGEAKEPVKEEPKPAAPVAPARQPDRSRRGTQQRRPERARREPGREGDEQRESRGRGQRRPGETREGAEQRGSGRPPGALAKSVKLRSCQRKRWNRQTAQNCNLPKPRLRTSPHVGPEIASRAHPRNAVVAVPGRPAWLQNQSPGSRKTCNCPKR